MKIKTAVNSDGCATVALCDADGTPVETRTIEPGQELETSLATVTDPQQVSVGEVCETGAATSESEARDATGGESAAADTGGEGGETADAGETAGGEGAGKDCGEGEGEAPTP